MAKVFELKVTSCTMCPNREYYRCSVLQKFVKPAIIHNQIDPDCPLTEYVKKCKYDN